MDELWSVVNEALITLLVALIALLSWYVRQWLQQKLDAGQLDIVTQVVGVAVRSAEQLGESNEDKKRMAIRVAEEWLVTRGIRLDLNALDAAVEAAVYQELKQFPVVEPYLVPEVAE